MLLHYCPEVKSVEEVVNSDIEEASQSQLKFVEEMTGSKSSAQFFKYSILLKINDHKNEWKQVKIEECL